MDCTLSLLPAISGCNCFILQMVIRLYMTGLIFWLADTPENYPHSSAGFYATGIAGVYKNITNFNQLDDIDLTKEISGSAGR